MPDEGKDELGSHSYRVTLEMLHAGMSALKDFDPSKEEPEALVWAIISRALMAQRSSGSSSSAMIASSANTSGDDVR